MKEIVCRIPEGASGVWLHFDNGYAGVREIDFTTSGVWSYSAAERECDILRRERQDMERRIADAAAAARKIAAICSFVTALCGFCVALAFLKYAM